MLAEDRAYLEQLQLEIWAVGQSSGMEYYKVERSLTDAERENVVAMLTKYRSELVFEPGGGPFGFGVSLNVLLPPSYPGVPATFLIRLSDVHVFGNGCRHELNIGKSYAFVEGFTHTDENRRIRQFSGFKDPLRKMSYYDY